MTAVVPKSSVSYASNSTSRRSPGFAPGHEHRPGQRVAEPEIEPAGVGVGALAGQLAVEAVHRLEPDLLSWGDLGEGLEIRVPAVVHQRSSRTRSAASLHAAVSASLHVRGLPSWWSETIASRRSSDEDRGDDLCREPAVGVEHPVERRVVERRAGIVLHDLLALLEQGHHRLRPEVDRALAAQRPDPRGESLVRHGEGVFAGDVAPEGHAVDAELGPQLFEHGGGRRGLVDGRAHRRIL